jgi:hypothetical protein
MSVPGGIASITQPFDSLLSELNLLSTRSTDLSTDDDTDELRLESGCLLDAYIHWVVTPTGCSACLGR